MKLSEETREVSTTLTGETKQFQIAINRKAFRTLVDGIYSDKIGSIVRELTSNAFDAHIRQGNINEPFELRLPNPMNPTFSVRDYGCSMDHATVMGLYSTLFESSKSDSNDEVGAFGLGAKSFFAYTDACTLTCWLDGERRTYMVSLDTDGIPSVTLVDTRPDNDRQGVEVNFAAEAVHFREFADAARRTLLGFAVQPKVLGSDVSLPVPAFNGNGWRIYKGNQNGLIHGHMVQQGCAVYPVGPGIYLDVTLPYDYYVVIDMPIGSCDVTTSREQLALTPDQKANVAKTLNQAVKGMHAQVQSKYHALGTELEKAKFAHQHAQILGNDPKTGKPFPTHVKLPFSLTKWSHSRTYGVQQNTHDTFSVDTLNRIVVILDDGSKLPRQIRRFTSYASGRSLYLTQSKAEWLDAKRILGLPDGQCIKIQDVPDIYVAPRPKRAKLATVKFDATRPWARAMRGSARSGDLTWNVPNGPYSSTVEDQIGYTSKERTLIRGLLSKYKDGILYLTDSEYAKVKDKLDPKQEVCEIIKAELASLIPAAEHTGKVKAFAGLSQAIRATLLTKVGLDKDPVIDPEIIRLFSRFHSDALTKGETEGRTIVGKLQTKYPLLFSWSERAAAEYISLIDAK